MCVVILSAVFCTLVSMQSSRYSGPILMKLDFFSGTVSKNTAKSNLMTIRPVGAELFHADGRTYLHD